MQPITFSRRSTKIISLMMVILTFFFVISCNPSAKKAEAGMVIINARIWTGNPNAPWATSLASEGNKIAAVGDEIVVRKYIDKGFKVVDAEGAMVTPGFIDSHIHFIDGGLNLSSVQLRDAGSPQEFTMRIGEYAKTIPAGTWITGGDWDHTQWGGELPRADWINDVTPKHPVFVSRLDGHMALANALAMKIAGVTKDTPDIEGGTIVRDSEGNPTGIFKDNAMYLINKVIPDPSPEIKEKALKAAMDYVAERGVTSVVHMGTWDDLHVFERAYKKGLLKTRIYACVPLPTWKQLADTIAAKGRGNDWLQIGGLKGFADGSLGSHTAAFFKPYTDDPKNSGLMVNSYDDLLNWTLNADKNNLQVVVHAIGDRAISEMLDIYEKVAAEDGSRDRRFRIEHAQHIAPKDIVRFRQDSVIASMQPYHAIDDGRWADTVIGPERAKTTYAFRSLLDAGVKLAFGSDWFVAPPTPLMGIYAAVTRRTLDGKHPDGWVPEQKIGVEEALRAYTTDAAYAEFDGKIKGSLEVGKLADFVMIDQDLINIPPEDISKAKILMTVVDGKIVYKK